MAAEPSHLVSLTERAIAEIVDADTIHALNAVRSRYLGRKGEVTSVLRSLGDADPSERASLGQAANRAKQAIEDRVAARRGEIENAERNRALGRQSIDVTLPGAGPLAGRLHPISLVMRDMVEFFTGMGFSIEEGPEVETEYNNFEALNIPDEHPARDEQDTFYLEGGNLLRTHTSSVQIRAMTGREPPFRFIAPGRVYRHDLSPRHSPMFHQIEGFMVDEDVNFADLKGILYAFARHLMQGDPELRFRSNHFPFTEPSAEMDYSCRLCDGQGCKVCSHTGWMEWGGCGMIHPRVLDRCGIDSDRFQGFAFGMGIDRAALLRYGVPHLRLLFEGDLRFLEQI
ncbi:phenylalanine--tRNA ligase subunit alpha [Myxococcota bacterium]|nr:phenylalanine--tRNA ligase subunit alpha [Myxococcota bacterium]